MAAGAREVMQEASRWEGEHRRVNRKGRKEGTMEMAKDKYWQKGRRERGGEEAPSCSRCRPG
eukprot:5159805-Prorocentrum_lima.AAC.1